MEIKVINVETFSGSAKYLRIDLTSTYFSPKCDTDNQIYQILFDINTGRILSLCSRNPIDIKNSFSAFGKVSDSAGYTLLDQMHREIKTEECDYVPTNLLGGNDCDYLEITAQDGYITSLPQNRNLSDFEAHQEDIKGYIERLQKLTGEENDQ